MVCSLGLDLVTSSVYDVLPFFWVIIILAVIFSVSAWACYSSFKHHSLPVYHVLRHLSQADNFWTSAAFKSLLHSQFILFWLWRPLILTSTVFHPISSSPQSKLRKTFFRALFSLCLLNIIIINHNYYLNSCLFNKQEI